MREDDNDEVSLVGHVPGQRITMSSTPHSDLKKSNKLYHFIRRAEGRWVWPGTARAESENSRSGPGQEGRPLVLEDSVLMETSFIHRSLTSDSDFSKLLDSESTVLS
ncbi:hypothetical protein KM043_010360 [Ampulex compressa]|nr:hypothetical protein KM043_010360 [Ampulex compressa]